MIDEKSAQEILKNRKIERDYIDPRNCAAIVIELACKNVDIAFDVVDAVSDSLGYTSSNA